MFNSSIRRSLPLIVAAATLTIAAGASAHDSAWRDKNCMFKSGMVQKGGEETRQSIYDTAKIKDQWCSPTTRNEARANDPYYKERMENRDNRAARAGRAAERNNAVAPAAGH